MIDYMSQLDDDEELTTPEVTQVDYMSQLDETPSYTGGGVNSLLNEDKYKPMAEYMEDRYGMTEEDYSREEIRDAFVNGMRGFNAGNSIDLATELDHLYRGDSAELNKRREIAGRAYDVWDSLSGAFSKDNTFGQKADAAKDYAKSMILDPVNIVSLGVGKFAAQGATKGAAQSLKVLAQKAAAAAAKEAVKKGVKGKALEAVKTRAFQRAMSEGLKTMSPKVAKRGIIADVTAAGITDVGINVGLDFGLQKADQLTGRSEEYDVTQGIIAGVGGALGAGISGSVALLRGTGGLPSATENLVRSEDLLEKAANLARTKPAVVAGSINVPKARRTLDATADNFRKYVEQGRFLSEGGDVAAELYTRESQQVFMAVLQKTLEDGGIPMSRLRGKSKDFRINAWYKNVVDSPRFPPELRERLQQSLEDIVGSIPGEPKPELSNWLNVNAERVSEAAGIMRATRATADMLKALGINPGKATAEEAIDAVTGGAPKGVRKTISEGFLKAQNIFIRMLVTNPATTALNVVGWAQASSLSSFGNVLRGTLYGSTAVLNGLVGRKTSYSKFADQAKLSFGLEYQKFRNLVDPQGTRDQVLDYLAYRPEAQDAMFRYLAGGVDSEDVLKELNLVPGETLTKNGVQKAFDALQVAYGVTTQDMLTKTQEFAYMLDKQIRLKYGQSWADFMKRDDIADILMNPKVTDYTDYMKIEATAVEDALRNVFALKMGDRKSNNPVERVAAMIEEARSIPVIGAMVPFGQFFNNTVSFMADHVGIGLVYNFASKGTRDPFELVLKAAVGMSVIGWAASQELENMEEGLSWDQERQDDGQVVTRIYDFPLSFWKMAGRIAAHIQRDGEIPLGIYEDFTQKFAGEDLFGNLGDAAEGTMNAIQAFASGSTGEGKQLFQEAVSASMGMYLSGMTRFLDPINTALAFAEGEDYVAPTRSIGNKGLNNAIRYTDRIFDNLIGLENMPFDASGYDVERMDPLTGEAVRGGSSLARIVGVRTEDPASNIQKIFNEVGRPQWKTELRIDNDEAQQTFNEFIYPYLEYRATQLMEGSKWGKASMAMKQEYLTQLIKEARSEVKEIMKGATSDSKNKKVSLIWDINGQKSSSSRVFKEVLDDFGTSEKDLADLDEPQLELLLWFLKERQAGRREDLKKTIK